VFGERQGTDALAGNGKDGVAHGRENRRESGFAKASRRIVGLEKMDLDFRGTWFMRTGGYSWKLLWTRGTINGDFVGHDGA